MRGIFGGEGAGELDEPLGKSNSRSLALLFNLLLSPRLSHRIQRRFDFLACGDGTQQCRGGQGERVEQQAQTGIGPGGTPRQGDSVAGARTGAQHGAVRVAEGGDGHRHFGGVANIAAANHAFGGSAGVDSVHNAVGEAVNPAVRSATGQAQGDEEARRARTHGGNVGEVLGRGFAPHIVAATAGGFQNELTGLTRPCDTAGPQVHKVLVLNESVGGDHGTLTGRGRGEDGTVVTGTHLEGFAAPRLACRCGNLLVVGVDNRHESAQNAGLPQL